MESPFIHVYFMLLFESWSEQSINWLMKEVLQNDQYPMKLFRLLVDPRPYRLKHGIYTDCIETKAQLKKNTILTPYTIALRSPMNYLPWLARTVDSLGIHGNQRFLKSIHREAPAPGWPPTICAPIAWTTRYPSRKDQIPAVSLIPYCASSLAPTYLASSWHSRGTTA